ncbi:hypothetical protein H4R18_005949 [Coemansia javaensis]|uniref:Uncharacterized protein n=1 Tax=Coemansia javaensis TaxID=2761396 RepID=A0A9W8LEM7_9FUNG|nr:hypothetical protein H4R18_005949 [Coemansia javaensis]
MQTNFSADGDESRDIWFPSLQVLDLGTCWEAAAGWTDETKDKGRLHFPALRALKARCKDGMPHALRRSVFPARMDRVTILATAPALLDISNMALPSARHFQLSTEGDIAINPAAVAAVQRILDRARDGDEVELIHHRDSRLLKRPEILALTPLTRLEALVDTSVDTVVEIIRCLPRLSSLDIRLQSAGSTPQGISVPEPGADRLVEPISSTLKCVRISFYHDDQNPEPAVLTLRYLLLAVPSLTAISAYGIPGVLMDSFIDAHADQYPHLARLKINIHANRR